jgi:hypothetical protein
MLFTEIVTVYCDNNTEHANTLRGQNSESQYVFVWNVDWLIPNCKTLKSRAYSSWSHVWEPHTRFNHHLYFCDDGFMSCPIRPKRSSYVQVRYSTPQQRGQPLSSLSRRQEHLHGGLITCFTVGCTYRRCPILGSVGQIVSDVTVSHSHTIVLFYVILEC